jgi:hypothetical protein
MKAPNIAPSQSQGSADPTQASLMATNSGWPEPETWPLIFKLNGSSLSSSRAGSSPSINRRHTSGVVESPQTSLWRPRRNRSPTRAIAVALAGGASGPASVAEGAAEDDLVDSSREHRVLTLAVNRLGENGRWDLDELKIEFEELILADAPIEISGFARRRHGRVGAARTRFGTYGTALRFGRAVEG